MTRLLKTGDRIRVKVRLISGWRGMATVMEDQQRKLDAIRFRPDGSTHEHCFCCRWECAKVRIPK